MAPYLETLKRLLEDDFEKASESERTTAIRELIQVSSIASAAVAIQPVPFVDSALIAPIQIGMVQGIGRIHGHRLDKKSVIEILSTLGASIVSQNIIMAAAKVVPFLGWAMSLSMAYALTFAIGEVSDHYFKSGRGASKEELRSMFERIYQDKKTEKAAEHQHNKSLKRRLEELQEAQKSGLLTEEEFQRTKEEILRDF